LEALTLSSFSQKGSCTFGADKCSYRHDCSLEGSIEEAKKTLVCPYFLKGKCRHKERCWFSHKCNAESDEDFAELIEDGEEQSSITEPIAPRSDETANPGTSSSSSSPEDEIIKCGICLENIIEMGERFALFSNCIHPFCYQCARNWHRNPSYRKFRKLKETNAQHTLVMHSCPLCRVDSEYMFPSKEHYIGAEKDAYIAKFKEERSDRKCKFFDGNLGSCPFGKECFYAHLGEDGIDLKPIDVRKSYKVVEDDASVSSDQSDNIVDSIVSNGGRETYMFDDMGNIDSDDGDDDLGTSIASSDRYNNQTQSNEYDSIASLFAQDTHSPLNQNTLSLGNMLSTYNEENDNDGSETPDWLPQLNMFSAGNNNIADQQARVFEDSDFQNAMEEQLRRLGNI